MDDVNLFKRKECEPPFHVNVIEGTLYRRVIDVDAAVWQEEKFLQSWIVSAGFHSLSSELEKLLNF